jgi:hypothetical protein
MPGLEGACSAWLSAVDGRRPLRKAALANQVMVSDTWFFPLANLEESFLGYIFPMTSVCFPQMNMEIIDLFVEFLRWNKGVAC